ncbi:MAG: hypothetical protein V9G20_13100 [Candidatus Promineifilaceae bacterium]
MLEQNPSLVIEICLRYPDGYPVVRESAWMEHMGDESYSTPSAFTDGAGYCTWLVYPGLHELCVPNHTLMGSLPILALRGSGLAVPGMVASAEKTTYHVVLDGDHLAFDATPLAPLPTPVRCLKRQTYELMIPAHEPAPLAYALGGAEGMATAHFHAGTPGDKRLGSAVHSPFMRLSTAWVLQPRPRSTDVAEPGVVPSYPPTFFYKSLNR